MGSTSVIIKQEMDFHDSYEVIEDMVNVSQIEQKANRLTETFKMLNYDKLKQPEKDKLRMALTELRKTIDLILNNL